MVIIRSRAALVYNVSDFYSYFVSEREVEGCLLTSEQKWSECLLQSRVRREEWGATGPRPAYFIRPDRISLDAGHTANITYKLQVYPRANPCNLSSMAFGSWNSYPGFQHGLKNSNSLSMIPSYPGSFRFIFSMLYLFRLVWQRRTRNIIKFSVLIWKTS